MSKKEEEAIKTAVGYTRVSTETKIKALLAVMESPATIWRGASLETRQLLQRMIFPDGAEVNLETLEFGTLQLSPLFSVITTKKDSNEPF